MPPRYSARNRSSHMRTTHSLSLITTYYGPSGRCKELLLLEFKTSKYLQFPSYKKKEKIELFKYNHPHGVIIHNMTLLGSVT